MAGLLLTVLSYASAAEAAQAKGVVLEQWCNLTGRCDVFVTKNALKIINRKNNWGIISRAPDWKVTVYNTMTHHYLVTDADKWMGQVGAGFKWITERGLSDCKWHQGGITHLDGFNLHEMLSDTSVNVDTSAAYGMKGRAETIRHSQMFLLAGKDIGIDIPAAGLKVICNNYGAPIEAGIPVSLVLNGTRSTTTEWLKTTQIKSTSVSDSTFAIGKNYERVRDAFHLNSSAAHSDQLSDFIESLPDPVEQAKRHPRR